MKKLFIINILLAVSFTYVAAQQEKDQLSKPVEESTIEAHVKKMTDLLSLTATQQQKIRDIEVEIRKIGSEKLKKVLGDIVAQLEMQYELKVLEEEKYRPVLTANQFKKYQEYNSEQREKIRETQGILRGNNRQ